MKTDDDDKLKEVENDNPLKKINNFFHSDNPNEKNAAYKTLSKKTKEQLAELIEEVENFVNKTDKSEKNETARNSLLKDIQGIRQNSNNATKALTNIENKKPTDEELSNSRDHDNTAVNSDIAISKLGVSSSAQDDIAEAQDIIARQKSNLEILNKSIEDAKNTIQNANFDNKINTPAQLRFELTHKPERSMYSQIEDFILTDPNETIHNQAQKANEDIAKFIETHNKLVDLHAVSTTNKEVLPFLKQCKDVKETVEQLNNKELSAQRRYEIYTNSNKKLPLEEALKYDSTDTYIKFAIAARIKSGLEKLEGDIKDQDIKNISKLIRKDVELKFGDKVLEGENISENFDKNMEEVIVSCAKEKGKLDLIDKILFYVSEGWKKFENSIGLNKERKVLEQTDGYKNILGALRDANLNTKDIIKEEKISQLERLKQRKEPQQHQKT